MLEEAICPFCRRKIKGSEKFKFFCPHCFLFFTKQEIKALNKETEIGK